MSSPPLPASPNTPHSVALPIECDRCQSRFTLFCPPGEAMLARLTCPQCHEVMLVPVPARPPAAGRRGPPMRQGASLRDGRSAAHAARSPQCLAPPGAPGWDDGGR
ncbi:MAG: hypothetical protein D6729_02925 [Deltaproteobacteria bacterium]|nr:MAG: hypothetical protein D6729_02925 [Deltaproteobacteria bacterium]